MVTSALTSTYTTLADWAQRQKPGGGVDEIINVIESSNPILGDANVMEGNLPTGNRTTLAVTEPAGSWRLVNYGVPAEKRTTEQVTDNCGILEAYSQVDEEVMKLNGNSAAFRASEDDAFVSGLSSTAATALLYGNQNTDPEKMHGLSPRYNSTSTGYTAQTITCGSADTDNTSIWLITWGPKTVSLIYPKGSKAGLVSNDLGLETVVDSSNNLYRAWRTQFQWHLGLCIRDYRYVIRLCNIDVSLLSDDAVTGADLMRKMVKAYWARPLVSLGKMARTYFYCNKTVGEFLHVQAQNKTNVNLTIDRPAGEPIVSFLGVPIHICDNIINAESLVN